MLLVMADWGNLAKKIMGIRAAPTCRFELTKKEHTGPLEWLLLADSCRFGIQSPTTAFWESEILKI